MIIGTGIMVNNVRAALNAFKSVLTRQESEFIRTPKFGKTQKPGYAMRGDALTRYEILFAVYSLIGLLLAIAYEPGLVPYMTLYTFSFTAVLLWNVYDGWTLNRAAKAVEAQPTVVEAPVEYALEADTELA
jgi:hypothetical protein